MKNNFTISKKVGVEITKSDATRSTGFALIDLAEGKLYTEKSTRFFYIILILKGEIILKSKNCSNRVIEDKTMVFIPKDSMMVIRALKDSEIIFFAFSTAIIRNDKELLDFYCKEAQKNEYNFNTLPIKEGMEKVTDLIQYQLASKKIRNNAICEAWNTLFFHTIQSYYSKLQIVSFFRPIFNGLSDFESFIETNYISSRGNVSRLIELSGIPPTRFYKLFVERYGMTAKVWLDNKMKNKILELASQPSVTVGEIALEFGLITPRFCTLCKRLFGRTPKEVIADVQEGKNLSMLTCK